MMAFMDKKVKKLIHAAKLKNHSFKESHAGDEFRIYSSNNLKLFEKDKFTEMLPIADQKLMKVRYPSKLEQYTKLRIEEERKEEFFINDMKKKL